MNDNTENILINVEKCVPTLIMRQLSSTRAFCRFDAHDGRAQTHTLGMPFSWWAGGPGRGGNGRVCRDQTGCGFFFSDAIEATHDQPWDKLDAATAPLIYSERPHVARIKTNLRPGQFISKGSLNEKQYTSNQTCLLIPGENKKSSLIFLP